MSGRPGLANAAFARRDGVSLEVEVLRLETLLRPPFKRATTAPTRTDFHTLLFVEAGDSSHYVDFERQPVGAGDLLVIPEGRVQAFDQARAIHGYLVLFTSGYLARCDLGTNGLAAAADGLLRAGLRVSLGYASRQRLHDAVATLARYAQPSPTDDHVDDAIAAAFALLVFVTAGLPEATTAVQASVSRDPLVTRFLVLLEENFRAWHQVSAYARALCVAPRTLDRHLRADQDRTTRQVIAARLVLEAKRLLTRQDLPVKSIAYALGFSEPNNFTRFFVTQTGLSPGAFRQSLVAG
ncbi:MAG: helix-turn-helix domain-containing protein [Gammaproteobacteria bacterium]